MKKTKFLIPLACLALVLSGCDEEKKPTTYVGDNGLTYAIETLTQSQTAAVLDGHDKIVYEDWEPNAWEDYKVLGASESSGYQYDYSKKFDDDDIFSSTYAYQGLLLVKNETGYVGFFSLITNDWILKPQFVPNTFKYEVAYNTYVGTLVELNYEETYFLYDVQGNLLAKSSEHIDLTFDENYIDIGYNQELKTTGISIWYYDDEYVIPVDDPGYTPDPGAWTTIHYLYSEKGVLAKSEQSWRDLEPEEEPLTPLDTPIHELDEYGYEGYVLMEGANGYNAVFKTTKDGHGREFVGSFYYDLGYANSHFCGVVGSKIIYQSYVQLPERAEDYDFSVGNNKFHLETYSFDINNNFVKEELKLKFFINSIHVLALKVEEHNFYQMDLFAINTHKVLGPEEMLVVNEDMVVVKDMSGSTPNNFVKVGKSYYNTQSKILFDSTMKPIASLKDFAQATVLREYDYILVRDGATNLYGLVDENGYLNYECKYSNIYTGQGIDKAFIAIDNEEHDIVNIGQHMNSVCIHDFNNVYFSQALFRSTYYDGLSTTTRFFTAQNELAYFSGNNYTTRQASLYGRNMYFAYETETLGLNTSWYTYSIVQKSVAFTANGGTELTAEFAEQTADDPFVLKLGENELHNLVNAYTYVTFTPAEDGKYGLHSDYVFSTTGREIYEEVVTEEPLVTTPHNDLITVTNTTIYDSLDVDDHHNVARVNGWEMKAGHTYRFSFYSNIPALVKINVMKEHEHEVAEWHINSMERVLIGEADVIRYGTCGVEGCGQTVYELANFTMEAIAGNAYKAELAEQSAKSYYGGLQCRVTGTDPITGQPIMEYTWKDNAAIAGFVTEKTMTATLFDGLLEQGYAATVAKYYFSDDATNKVGQLYQITFQMTDTSGDIHRKIYQVGEDATIISLTEMVLDPYYSPKAVTYEFDYFILTKAEYDAAYADYQQAMAQQIP